MSASTNNRSLAAKALRMIWTRPFSKPRQRVGVCAGNRFVEMLVDSTGTGQEKAHTGTTA